MLIIRAWPNCLYIGANAPSRTPMHDVVKRMVPQHFILI